ncbi:WD40 repeat domain-containing protein [Nonomuraea recticatena]|uniref:WD40 repeat domain-containing protein n=1 Tax=Nonomuraea recticatena TaxID=46178 RepID=UPI003605F8EA
MSQGAPVQRAVVGGRAAEMRSVSFDPVTGDLVTADAGGRTVLWETSRLGPPAVLTKVPQEAVGRGALAADGRRLVTVTAEHALTLWELGGDLPRRALLAEDAGQVSALAAGDGVAVTGGEDGTAALWRPSRHDTSVTARLSSRITAVASAGGWALAGAADGSAALWPLSSRDPVRLPPARGSVDAVAVSANGRLAATGDASGRVRLWSLADPGRPAVVADFPAALDGIVSAALSADGRRLLVGGSDKLARLWDVGDPAKPVRLADLDNDFRVVASVGFALGSSLAYTGAGGGPVSLWHVTGEGRRAGTRRSPQPTR